MWLQASALPTTTAWATAWAQQLLARHGVLTREAAAAETSVGGFGVVYPVLKAMEESGKIRRGYFVAGLGATQFALPGALDLLRSLREPSPDDAETEVVVLSATDPANPYGAAIRFPVFAPRAASAGQARGAPTDRAIVGATVILVNGALGAYLARGDRMLLTFLPEAEPQRSRTRSGDRACAARTVANAGWRRSGAARDVDRGDRRRAALSASDGAVPRARPGSSAARWDFRRTDQGSRTQRSRPCRRTTAP